MKINEKAMSINETSMKNYEKSLKTMEHLTKIATIHEKAMKINDGPSNKRPTMGVPAQEQPVNLPQGPVPAEASRTSFTL